MGSDLSWKKDEAEIDLMELVCSICLQWKQILACALIVSILAGGYSVWKNKGSQDETVLEEIAELTEEEIQAVEEAVQLEKHINDMNHYMDSSILMQVDPYHKNRTVSLYSIEGASRQSVAKIAESYLNFITNGGVIEALKKSDSDAWDADSCYLAEVITAWQKTDTANRIVVEGGEESMPAGTLLYIEVTGKDAGMARRLSADIWCELRKYRTAVKEVCGSHDLLLISEEDSVRIDSELLAKQNEKRNQLKTDQANLKTITNSFREKQWEMFHKNESLPSEIEQTAVMEQGNDIHIKYILAGFLGGVFAYCAIYIIRYLMHDTIKSTAEFQSGYTIPLYGNISLKKAGRHGKSVSSDRDSTKESGTKQVLECIRLSCKQKGIGKLCLDAGFEPDVQEKECLADMAEQLRTWGINAVITESGRTGGPQWDVMAEMGAVLVICRIKTTTHREIDERMGFCNEMGIRVIGAVMIKDQVNRYI